ERRLAVGPGVHLPGQVVGARDRVVDRLVVHLVAVQVAGDHGEGLRVTGELVGGGRREAERLDELLAHLVSRGGPGWEAVPAREVVVPLHAGAVVYRRGGEVVGEACARRVRGVRSDIAVVVHLVGGPRRLLHETARGANPQVEAADEPWWPRVQEADAGIAAANRHVTRHRRAE